MTAEPNTPRDPPRASGTSKLAFISAVVGVTSGAVFVLSILIQLALGPNQILLGPYVIGATDYGAYLFQHGFSMYLADIMDKLDQSPLTALAVLLGLLAIVLGLVALISGFIRKEKIGLAVIGIVTGSIVFDVTWGPFVLPL